MRLGIDASTADPATAPAGMLFEDERAQALRRVNTLSELCASVCTTRMLEHMSGWFYFSAYARRPQLYVQPRPGRFHVSFPHNRGCPTKPWHAIVLCSFPPSSWFPLCSATRWRRCIAQLWCPLNSSLCACTKNHVPIAGTSPTRPLRRCRKRSRSIRIYDGCWCTSKPFNSEWIKWVVSFAMMPATQYRSGWERVVGQLGVGVSGLRTMAIWALNLQIRIRA